METASPLSSDGNENYSLVNSYLAETIMLTTCFIDGQKVSIADYNKEGGKEPLCPLGHRLMAKKGKHVIHHFAHYPSENCDRWREGLTTWHSQWQEIVADKTNIEVCLNADGITTGHSSFNGYRPTSANQSKQTPSNQLPSRPPVVSIPQVAIPDLISTAPASPSFTGIPFLSQTGAPQLHIPAFLRVPDTVGTDEHIADIICPRQQGRPLVIEIQHSSIDEDTIRARELYYKDMIWMFDLTPRVVKKGKHNKTALVDGKISYLKDKVAYVAAFSSTSRRPLFAPYQSSPSQQYPNQPRTTFDQVEFQSGLGSATGLGFVLQNQVRCTGDECLSEELSPLGGLFVIINTRTKYWYQASCPTYFDSGYGILRLLQPLERGFALTLFISYEDFFRERMPALSKEILDGIAWFHTASPLDLIRSGIFPKILDAQEVQISKTRVIIKGLGNELNGLGLERGADDWHGGSFYRTPASAALTSTSSLAALSSSLTQSSATRMASSQTSSSTDTLLTRYLEGGVVPARPATDQLITGDVLFISRLRKFLCSLSLEVEIETRKTCRIVIVYCDRETYNLKEKFSTLGMKYSRGGVRKISKKQALKSSHQVLVDAVSAAVAPSTTQAYGEPSKGAGRAYYSGQFNDIEAKLVSLL
jgi:hypothetical protein